MSSRAEKVFQSQVEAGKQPHATPFVEAQGLVAQQLLDIINDLKNGKISGDTARVEIYAVAAQSTAEQIHTVARAEDPSLPSFPFAKRKP